MKSLRLLIQPVVTERKEGKQPKLSEVSKQEQRAPCICTLLALCTSSAYTGVNLEKTGKDSWEQTRREHWCDLTILL